MPIPLLKYRLSNLAVLTPISVKIPVFTKALSMTTLPIPTEEPRETVSVAVILVAFRFSLTVKLVAKPVLNLSSLVF